MRGSHGAGGPAWRRCSASAGSSRPCCSPVNGSIANGSRRTTPDLAGGGGGGLAAHRRGHVHALDPVARLGHQRHGGRAAAAEDEGVDGHAIRVVPIRVEHRVVGRRRTVKREFGCAAGRSLPSAFGRSRGVQSLPCQSIRCAGGVSVMPSHQTSPSSVSATLVKMTSRSSDPCSSGWSGLVGARGDAEVAGLGVDGVQAPIGVRA